MTRPTRASRSNSPSTPSTASTEHSFAGDPVLIRADRRTKHTDVKAVMDICTQSGIWRINFAAIKEEKL